MPCCNEGGYRTGGSVRTPLQELSWVPAAAGGSRGATVLGGLPYSPRRIYLGSGRSGVVEGGYGTGGATVLGGATVPPLQELIRLRIVRTLVFRLPYGVP